MLDNLELADNRIIVKSVKPGLKTDSGFELLTVDDRDNSDFSDEYFEVLSISKVSDIELNVGDNVIIDVQSTGKRIQLDDGTIVFAHKTQDVIAIKEN